MFSTRRRESWCPTAGLPAPPIALRLVCLLAASPQMWAVGFLTVLAPQGLGVAEVKPGRAARRHR